MPPEQAGAEFESLDALRILQCDVHHFGDFTLPGRFYELFEALTATKKTLAGRRR